MSLTEKIREKDFGILLDDDWSESCDVKAEAKP